MLVFEDLHCADDGLLDFVDYLVDWASGVPLLVVATARPGAAAHAGPAGAAARRTRSRSRSRRSPTRTRRGSCTRCSSGRCCSAEVQETLLARAGGNPLYAEEFVRMLAERRPGRGAAAETVQGLIAARLDALPAEEKALLQDAAVLGKVFWLGAAAALAEVERLGGGGAAARARAQGVRSPGAPLVGGRRDRVRVPAPARPRRRLRPDPARRARRQASAGGGVDRRRSAGRRITPSCSPTTT